MKKWIFSSGILLSFVIASALAAQAQRIAVETMVVQPKTFSDKLISIGTVLSQRSTYVQTEIAGRVVALTKNVGDHIAAGMAVAKISPEITHDTLIEAKAVHAKAEAAYSTQQKVVSRVKRLVSAHATTLSVLEAEQAKLNVYKSDLIASQAQLSKAIFAMNHTTVRSTVSGTVQELKVTLGSVIAAGDPIYLISNVDQLKAVLPFPQNDRNRIRLGQQVELIASLTKQRVIGQVDGIEPIINPVTRSFSVIVNFKNNQHLWHPGSSVTGYVNLGSKRTVFVVPEMSVVNNTNGDFIFVIHNGKAHRVKVTTGEYILNGNVEIVSGLQSSQRIVTKGAAFLEEGTPVREE